MILTLGRNCSLAPPLCRFFSLREILGAAATAAAAAAAGSGGNSTDCPPAGSLALATVVVPAAVADVDEG